MKKVLIVSSSSVVGFEKVKGVCDFVLNNDNDIVVVYGGNSGIYDFGIEYADEYDFDVKEVKGLKNENVMLRSVDELILFAEEKVWKDSVDVEINNLLSSARVNSLSVNIINV
jgi:hypothetical protein